MSRTSATMLLLTVALAGAAIGCVPDGAVLSNGMRAPAAGVAGHPLAAILATAPVDSSPLARFAANPPALRLRWTAAPPVIRDFAHRGLPASLRDSLSSGAVGRVLRSVSGEATYYADKFEGRETASGTIFRQDDMVAAHRGFPFGTLLRVTNTRNNRSVQVRVVDRGPWGARAAARNTIIDLSRKAARQLGYIRQGRTPVRIDVLEWGPGAASNRSDGGAG